MHLPGPELCFGAFHATPAADYRTSVRTRGLCCGAPGYVAPVDVDREGKQPIYLQIAAILRDRVTSGQIAPGRPLPSERTLVQEFGVSPLTARKAVRVLVAEGLVEVVQGRGAYVRE